MKIITRITIVLAACALLAGCYEDYVKDYDYSTIYCAFQYDLRTFVVGEGEKFDFTVGLAGVMQNTRDRKVKVELANDLVTADLPTALGLKDYSPFTAYQGMLGQGKFGLLSQSYVSNEVKATGANALVPLPEQYFNVSGLGDMCIKAGRHTDAVTITATGAFLTDPDAIVPKYALAFRITSADADKLPVEKSFEVIAVKYECKYFGNWYYGGERKIVDKLTGKEVSKESYPLSLPQDDSKIYTLTTTGPNSVKTNKIGQRSGSFELLFSGENVIASCSDPKVTMGYCYTNGAKAIQDRVIYLNYSYDNGDGTTSVVSDYLTFRNRIRDGISEWQDENPANYE
ncbi:MAG: DUF1735 domain-containing protein [Bacteroidales bacterium]|nr:DUF1735 domain-containing protein [Bacteroidales bacterium]